MNEDINVERLQKAIERGIVCEVKELLEAGNCDVNQCKKSKYDRDVIRTLPLFVLLSSIQTKDDEFYQISNIFLSTKHIDVNKGEGELTILGQFCDAECSTTLGAEFLLRHKDIDVNKGWRPALHYACENIKEKEDYFHKVTKLLLQHIDIDVNATYGGYASILSTICEWGCRCLLGCKILLEQKQIDVNKGDPAFQAARKGYPDLF